MKHLKKKALMKKYQQPQSFYVSSIKLSILLAQLQGTGQGGEGEGGELAQCELDLPEGAITVQGVITDPTNIESCDSNSVVLLNFGSIDVQLSANMCIIPDGTSAPDVRIVFGTSISSFSGVNGMTFDFIDGPSGGSIIGTKVFGTNHQVPSESTVNVDLDNVDSGNQSNLDQGNSPTEVESILITLVENGSSVISIDCLEGL